MTTKNPATERPVPAGYPQEKATSHAAWWLAHHAARLAQRRDIARFPQPLLAQRIEDAEETWQHALWQEFNPERPIPRP